MITTEDIASIIMRDLWSFDMPKFIKGHIPIGKVGEEGRIVILPKEDSDGKIFDKCFVEVNFLLPDIEGETNIGLDEIERNAYTFFKESKAGQYENQWYTYSFSRRSVEQDTDLECHYVHIQVLFEILNVINE